VKWASSHFYQDALGYGAAVLLLLPLFLSGALFLSSTALVMLARAATLSLWQKVLNAQRRRRVRSLCRTPKSSNLGRPLGNGSVRYIGSVRGNWRVWSLLTATLAVFLILLSGCSTTPYQTAQPNPQIRIPTRCPDLEIHLQAGTITEISTVLLVVTGKYYECQSKMDDALKIVNNHVDKPK